MKRIRISTLLAGLGCCLSMSAVNQAQAQSSAQVLFGPTQTQIVVHVETEFTVPASPNFEQIYSYQSGGPQYWEADFVELQSPFHGDGSPGLVVAFYSGDLEQGLQVFIPNSYLRSNTAFRLNSDPLSPPDGVHGVAWSFWFSEAVPMSVQGRVEYDAESNVAHVSVTFFAGILPTSTDQIRDLIGFIDVSPGIERWFEKRLIKSLETTLAAVNAGRIRLATVQLAVLIREVEIARSRKRELISDEAAEHIISAAKLIVATLH